MKFLNLIIELFAAIFIYYILKAPKDQSLEISAYFFISAEIYLIVKMAIDVAKILFSEIFKDDDD